MRNTEEIWRLVDAKAPEAIELSDRVWGMPELCYAEHRSCAEHTAMLEAHGFRVKVVEGIKGAELKASEYFQRIQFWRSRSGRMMTPGELGCALSLP